MTVVPVPALCLPPDSVTRSLRTEWDRMFGLVATSRVRKTLRRISENSRPGIEALRRRAMRKRHSPARSTDQSTVINTRNAQEAFTVSAAGRGFDIAGENIGT